MTILDWIIVAIGMYLVLVGLAAKHAPTEEVEPPHLWEDTAARTNQTITTRETAL